MHALAVMAEITITVNPVFLGHLRGIVDAASKSLQRRPAVYPSLADEADKELLEAWESSLLASLNEDLEALTSLMEQFRSRGGELTVPDSEAEKLLRAASALRLRLRETCFKHLSENALESGAVDFRSLSLEDQRVYGAYLFLASLQEQLVDELDDEAGAIG